MTKKRLPKQTSNKIAIFEGEEIRRVVIDGEWFYSVEDIVLVLTESTDTKQYIKKLRQRDDELNSNWGTICTPLPLIAKDGKRRLINCSDTEGIFRIIQSIPSKKAEPFKRWLARIGKERLDEIEQPSKAIERAKGYYLQKGYSQQWVETRTASIDTRHKFTDTLKDHGIKENYEYAILTNELYSSSFGLDSTQYRGYKGLTKKDSLRDNMTPMELAAVIFSEATSTEIISETNADGFIETKNAIHIAGNITKEAIQKIEKETGKKVITHKNAKELDSPEIRKELAKQSSTYKQEEIDENLSDFNKNLKKALDYNPKKENK
jgi:prophage antirepressor-like protein